jgi:hypothetical protein
MAGRGTTGCAAGDVNHGTPDVDPGHPRRRKSSLADDVVLTLFDHTDLRAHIPVPVAHRLKRTDALHGDW